MSKIKPVLDFLGIEANPEDENFMEVFKESFSKTHIARNKVFEDDELNKTINGRILSPVSKTVKKAFKDIISLEDEEIKDKTYNEILEIGLQKVTKKLEETENTWREKAKSSTDENYKALELKYKEDKTLWEQERNLIPELKSQVEEKDKMFSEFKQNFEKEQKINDLYKELKFNSKVDDLTLKGFRSHIDEISDLKLDENKELMILEKGSGKRFSHPTKSAEFLSPIDLIKIEADKRGYLEKTPAQPASQQQQQTNQPQEPRGVSPFPRF